MKKNSQFLNTKELLLRWQIEPFDLLYLIKNGEIPAETDDRDYTIDGRRVVYGEWDSLSLPDLEEKNFFFNISDVKHFEKKHPEYAPQDTPYESSQGEIPPYLDKKNKYFCKELSIAIETWLAIYGADSRLNSDEAHKKKIIAYLKKHHPSLAGIAVERISTMINAKKKGGAPKTSY